MRAPRIPKYGEQQVEERPLSGPAFQTEAPLAAFGGGEAAQQVTNQAEGLAGDVQRRAEYDYQNEYKRAVQLQGLELANKLTAEETRAKSALAQVKGKDAIRARENTLRDYDKFYQEMTKGVQNKDVKMLALEHFSARRNTLDAFATPYANGQMAEWANNELQSSIDMEMESVATDPSPANFAIAKGSQKLAIAEFGEANGKGAKWIEEQQRKAESATAILALRTIASTGNDKAAKDFFDNNKQDFFGRDVVTANGLVEDTSYRGLAQREVMRIMAGSTPDDAVGPPQEPTEKETYAEVDKIEDPKLQDMVRARLRERWADKKRIDHDAQVAAVTKAADIIEADPSIDAIPSDLWEQVPMREKAAIQRRILQIKEGRGPQALGDKYLSYVREAAVDPNTFVRRNFAAMRDEITAKEAEDLTKEQAGIIKGDVKQARKRDGLVALDRTGRLRLAALNVTDKDDIETFMNALHRDFYTWEGDPKNAGKPFPPEEAQTMVGRLLSERKRWWWSNTYSIQKIADVPQADRAAIEKKLREAGEAPTEGRVIEIYNQGK